MRIPVAKAPVSAVQISACGAVSCVIGKALSIFGSVGICCNISQPHCGVSCSWKLALLSVTRFSKKADKKYALLGVKTNKKKH